MMRRIIRLPIPNIFIFERCNLSDDDGSIMSNMRPKMSFFVFGLAIFLMCPVLKKVYKKE